MIGLYRSLLVCTVVFLSAGFSQPDDALAESAPVERLMTVLPDDLLGFAATSGGDYLKPEFEKSILGRMWNDAGLQTFYQSIEKAVLAKIKQEVGDANAAAVPERVMELFKVVAGRPAVFGVALKETKEGPPVYGFAIVDAGVHEAEIASVINRLEELAGKDEIGEVTVGPFKMRGPKDDCDVSGYWGWVGNYLVFAANEREGLATKYLTRPRTVSPEYLKKVSHSGDALAVYIDCRKIASALKATAVGEGAGEEASMMTAAVKELGLSTVKAVSARAGFVGSDVVCRQLVEVEGPRTGLLTHLRTINLSVFEMVDARAMNAAAVNCDVGGIYDTIMKAIKVAGPDDFYAEIERDIGNLESDAKFSIRRDLLASIAGPMVLYTVPAGVMMEAPSGGAVGIAKVKNSESLEKALAALGQFAAGESEGMLQVGSQVQGDGRTYHSWVIAPLAMMQVMPCWTVAEGQLIIASNPTLCSLAVKQVVGAGPEKKSLRTTEGFRKATASISHSPIMFYYADSQVQFGQMMIKAQQFWPMATMFASQAGIQLPVMLPSLSDIAKDMGPSYKYSWFDSEGVRCYCQAPGFEAGAVMAAPMGAAVLIPALGQAREQAREAVSRSNLHQIALVLKMYSDDHEGMFPNTLGEAKPYYHDERLLESPRKPKDFAGPSYIYIAHETPNIKSAARYIVVHENPEFCRDRINALFLDFSVRAMSQEEFLKALEETYELLGRTMPEIKFRD